MKTDIVKCQNCSSIFTIEQDDFAFYDKIQVPSPTWCPECKMIRRMTWRNERILFKKESVMEGGVKKSMLSMYAPETDLNTYDQKYWWSDAWDVLDYGRDYDFSKPFFTQFSELLHRVPLLALSNSNAVNSEYCNVADQSKDCYLICSSFKCERTMYSNRVYHIKDSSDIYIGFNQELCYNNVSCTESYRLFYSLESDSCTDSYFLYDCKNCTHCFGCVNLRNASYQIFNQQYSKEEYFKKIEEFNLGSWNSIQTNRKKFDEIYHGAIHRFARITKSVDVSGDMIDNAKNCHNCFEVTEGAQDCKNLHWGGIQTSDAWDSGPGIGDGAQLLYEVMDTGIQSGDIIGGNVVYGSHNIRYALYCHGSAHLFGCISVRSKQYCILNKQYTKEEYEASVPKIIEHMNTMPYVDKKGREYRFGDFFPPELSPYAYNESIAQDYFPLTRQQAIDRGYPWREAAQKQYKVDIKAEDLPDSIKDIGSDILDKIVGCQHGGTCDDGCSTAFKITDNELKFYQKMLIPLPRLCFNCRFVERLQKKNTMRLHHRACTCDKLHPQHSDNCPNEFETTFEPGRPETVYCESCYQAEIA